MYLFCDIETGSMLLRFVSNSQAWRNLLLQSSEQLELYVQVSFKNLSFHEVTFICMCAHIVVKEQLGAAPVSFYHVGSRVKCRASGLRMRGLPSESLTLYFKSKTLVPEQTVQREQTFIYLGWTTGKPSLPQKRVWPSWGHQSREQVFTVQVR